MELFCKNSSTAFGCQLFSRKYISSWVFDSVLNNLLDVAKGRRPYSNCHAKRHFDAFGGWVGFKKIWVTFYSSKMLKQRNLLCTHNPSSTLRNKLKTFMQYGPMFTEVEYNILWNSSVSFMTKRLSLSLAMQNTHATFNIHYIIKCHQDFCRFTSLNLVFSRSCLFISLSVFFIW